MFSFFNKTTRSSAPSIPEGHRVYAIGDIHGCLRELQILTQRIQEDIAQSPDAEITEIYLGDYIDRGPDSCGVISWLITAPLLGAERICLKGNHELFALSFLENASIFENWKHAGGREMLLSYGVQLPLPKGQGLSDLHALFSSSLPQKHKDFLNALKLSYSIGDYFFVHAGVRPGIALDQQKEDDLLWIRGDFLESRYDFGKVIVHGHTPCEVPEVLYNRINIDTGAYLSKKLTCLVLEGTSQRFIHSID